MHPILIPGGSANIILKMPHRLAKPAPQHAPFFPTLRSKLKVAMINHTRIPNIRVNVYELIPQISDYKNLPLFPPNPNPLPRWLSGVSLTLFLPLSSSGYFFMT
jgi:hypothetical protein